MKIFPPWQLADGQAGKSALLVQRWEHECDALEFPRFSLDSLCHITLINIFKIKLAYQWMNAHIIYQPPHTVSDGKCIEQCPPEFRSHY